MNRVSKLIWLTVAFFALSACSAATDAPEASKAENFGTVTSALNIPDSLTLTSAAAITMRRTSLINYVWGQNTLPTRQASTQAVTDICQTSGLPNLSTTTQLRAAMPNGKEAFACHLRPIQSNGRAVVLHHGHGCRLADGSSPTDDDAWAGMYRTAYRLLSDGFGVIFVYMPGWRPGDCAGKAASGDHGEFVAGAVDPHPAMVALTPRVGSSLQFFLGGTLQAINQVQGLGLYQEFNMIGLSGGGWTTTWYAALDPRIKTSFVMSGAMPFQFWPTLDSTDEQTHSTYYNGRTGYKDLFLMATDQGRRQIHVLRRHDTCCFNPSWNIANGDTWANNVHAYEAEVRAAEVSIPGTGSFRLEIDETDTSNHTISRNGVTNVILSELEGARRYVGADSGVEAFVRGANGHLWRQTGTGTWSDTGLNAVGVPAVLHIAGANQHSVDVFYRTRANQLAWAFPNGSGGWTENIASGVIISDPAVVSRGANLWDLVAIGTDYVPYWLSSGSFGSGFQTTVASARVLGPPSLVGSASTANELNMYVRGLGEGVYLLSWNGSSWSLDSGLQTGVLLGFPAGAQTTGGVKTVYAFGKDNQLYVNSKAGGTWSNWSSVSFATGTTGTPLLGSPSAALSTTAVVARTSTQSLQAFTSSGGVWTPGNLGGTFVGTPTRVPTGTWVRTSAGTLWYHNGSVWSGRGGWFE